MAITRAQQAKQMLREGGRIGFKGGADAATVGFDKSYDERAGTDDRPRSVNISPTGGVTTSTDAPDPVDDRGNPLQNRNQRNIIEYNKNLKKIDENKKLNFIERFNAKKRLKNQRFINQKYSKLAAGIAEKYGLSQDQIQDLLSEYQEDTSNQKGLFSKMQDILDMDPSARNLGENFNEDIMKGALGSIELSERMKKGVPLSTAELFSTVDPTTRIELPSPLLQKLQGPETFSNVLSGLNRLSALDAISKTPGGVKQSDIDNYFGLTMGKGGVDPITGENVDALFSEPPGGGRDDTPTDPCKGPNPPAYCFIGEKADETVEAQRNLGGSAPRFEGSIFNFDGMADGGRIGAAEGGIMDLETGRQMYFLGKLVKKATKAVKKIAKSPIGKAALAFGAYKLGSPLFGKGTFFGTGFNPLKDSTKIGPMSSGLGKLLSKVGLTNFATGDLTLAGKIGLGFGIPAALSLFNQPEEEEQDMNMGPELTMAQLRAIRNSPYRYTAPRFEGSQYKFAEGGEAKEPVAKKTMPLLDMGGKEMDLRDDGGFVPIGRMEKADDVPARLSKNEFVFTADAVRNAGEGDVDKGAEVMYNMMKNLESGGEVSEESQGLEGARKMFQTSKRLEEVL